MTFALRLATSEDLAAIMQLENASFATDAWSTATMRSELASANTEYLVAFDSEQEGELAGYAGLQAPRGSGDADIQTISVAPDFRRRGLGRMLMLALMAEALSRGARFVFLEVRADNPNARALYDALGFEQVSVRVGYYQPDGVDAQIMRFELPPEEVAS